MGDVFLTLIAFSYNLLLCSRAAAKDSWPKAATKALYDAGYHLRSFASLWRTRGG